MKILRVDSTAERVIEEKFYKHTEIKSAAGLTDESIKLMSEANIKPKILIENDARVTLYTADPKKKSHSVE